jgi:hypothetical protein
MVFLFSVKFSVQLVSRKLTGDLMLGPKVTRITLVYAEKVKFIAFTFLRSHKPSFGLITGSVRPGTVGV